MSDELLTVAEAADWVGFKPKTIYRWVKRGDVRAVRFGRSLRIRREDVEQLINAHLETASSAGSSWGEGPAYPAGSRWWDGA